MAPVGQTAGPSCGDEGPPTRSLAPRSSHAPARDEVVTVRSLPLDAASQADPVSSTWQVLVEPRHFPPTLSWCVRRKSSRILRRSSCASPCPRPSCALFPHTPRLPRLPGPLTLTGNRQVRAERGRRPGGQAKTLTTQASSPNSPIPQRTGLSPIGRRPFFSARKRAEVHTRQEHTGGARLRREWQWQAIERWSRWR